MFIFVGLFFLMGFFSYLDGEYILFFDDENSGDDGVLFSLIVEVSNGR